jgi:glycosyltransferase involved in cell wall biosynthesis
LETLRAVAAQVVPQTLRWEVVVVDNNSSDTTRETVLGFSETTSVSVRYKFEPKQGQSVARNSGIAVAGGDVILFTDDDILPKSDWVAKTLATMATAALDAVGGRVLPRWEDEPPPWLLARRDLLRWLALTEEETAGLLAYPMVASRRLVGANMAFRRRLFEEYGVFNSALGHRGTRLYGGEEVEFINRLLLANKTIGYDPSIVVYHRIDATRLRKSFFLRRFFDHAVGEAKLVMRKDVAMMLGVERWRYRHFVSAAWRALVHTGLRRSDAFALQLDLATEAGEIWGSFVRAYHRLDAAGK